MRPATRSSSPARRASSSARWRRSAPAPAAWAAARAAPPAPPAAGTARRSAARRCAGAAAASPEAGISASALASSASSTRSAWASNCSPATVKPWMPRRPALPRSTSRVPASASSSARVFDIAGWLSARRSAARARWRSCATATRQRRCRSCTPRTKASELAAHRITVGHEKSRNRQFTSAMRMNTVRVHPHDPGDKSHRRAHCSPAARLAQPSRLRLFRLQVDRASAGRRSR